MTMHSHNTGVADELMAAASTVGPMWQDITIAEAMCVLAAEHQSDIIFERETEDGYLKVKVVRK